MEKTETSVRGLDHLKRRLLRRQGGRCYNAGGGKQKTNIVNYTYKLV